jgi:co-chaperonin GroES (HSP10)
MTKKAEGRFAEIEEAATHTKPRQIRGCFVKPNGYRLIVERDGFKYSGALYIPEKNRIPPTTGVVVAVPADGSLDQWLGKRVIWSQLSGTPISFKNLPKYFAMQIEEIIGEITVDEKLIPEAPEVGGGYGS